jgi:hypothetical protein
MSSRGNAGWIGICEDVGAVELGPAILLTTSLFEIIDIFDEAVVGRELFSLSANLAAFFLCHRRLLGNGRLGSEVHRPYRQYRNKKRASLTCAGT